MLWQIDFLNGGEKGINMTLTFILRRKEWMNQQEERDEVGLKWSYLPVYFLPQLLLTQTS